MLDVHFKVKFNEDREIFAKLFKCLYCSERYNGFHRLSRHMMAVHSVKAKLEEVLPDEKLPYKCPECTHTFYDPQNLRVHRRKIHKIFSHRLTSPASSSDVVQRVFCHFCGAQSANKFCMLKHLKKFHVSVGRSGLDRFRCAKCYQMFAFRQDRDNHQGVCTQVEKFRQCCQCQTFFDSFAELLVHFHDSHPEPQPFEVTNKKRRFECTLCLKRFFRAIDLSAHFSVKPELQDAKKSGKKKLKKEALPQKEGHTFPKPFKCSSCEVAFASVRSLKGHLLKKHNIIATSEALYPTGERQVLRGNFYFIDP